MIGSRFGRLVVVAQEATRGGNKYWRCQCDCGGQSVSQQGSLRNGQTKSCGCLKIEKLVARVRIGEIKTQHHMSKTSEHRIWKNMRQRCFNPKNDRFYAYGGRGITVCERWATSFENFYEDVGPRPSRKHSIDRKDNDGNYEPGNCRWATPREQQLNAPNKRRGKGSVKGSISAR